MAHLLRIADVEERLGVSRRQVYRYFASGDLRRVYIGPRSPRVRESDLDAFLAECFDEGTDEGADE